VQSNNSASTTYEFARYKLLDHCSSTSLVHLNTEPLRRSRYLWFQWLTRGHSLNLEYDRSVSLMYHAITSTSRMCSDLGRHCGDICLAGYFLDGAAKVLVCLCSIQYAIDACPHSTFPTDLDINAVAVNNVMESMRASNSLLFPHEA
jgi:hypothetical protein